MKKYFVLHFTLKVRRARSIINEKKLNYLKDLKPLVFKNNNPVKKF